MNYFSSFISVWSESDKNRDSNNEIILWHSAHSVLFCFSKTREMWKKNGEVIAEKNGESVERNT